MVMNRRRHHAFISSRNIWPPNIRHHALKMLEVALRRARSKGHRRREYQNAQQHIALRRLKQQLDIVPRQYEDEDQGD